MQVARDGRITLDLDDPVGLIISLLNWSTLFHHDSNALLKLMSWRRLK